MEEERTMRPGAVLLAFLLFRGVAGANPLVAKYFTELAFDANGWQLELCPSFPLVLDGWYLESNSGRAYFKSGIHIGTACVIITADSMFTPLAIDPLGDRLVMGDSVMAHAGLTFGSAGIGVIAAPFAGQSLCLSPGTSDHFWYLDNTPTLGFPNDFLNATGTLQGTVRNVSGVPLRAVQVYYHYWPDQWVYSDSAGRFTISDYARVEHLHFIRPGYQSLWAYEQLWPENTITREYTLHRGVVYPLHVGNRWNWGGFEQKILADTLMPNGKTYAHLHDPGTFHTQYPYQRYEDNRVYVHEFRGKQDQLVYDFTRSAGDTIATIALPTDTTDIMLTWVAETELFGRTRRQWGFRADVRHIIDEELYQVITDSIGVTREEGMWFSADLLGAAINGVTYGTIADVSGPTHSLQADVRMFDIHPNPFNPTATIRYQLPVQTHVTLKAFDLLGRDVATILDGVEEPGFKSVRWTAGGLSSGVYFVKLEAGGIVNIRKVVLMR
jgi:hypothetical protein